MTADAHPGPVGAAGPGSSAESAPRRDQRLPRALRLRRSRDFTQTYAQGRRYVGRYMVLWLRDAEDAALRLGVVASRKVGNAVHRARAKRRLREAYRRNRWRFFGRVDVVLVGRRAILDAAWPEVERELLALAQRAGILEEPL